jgi:hypothetical protein
MLEIRPSSRLPRRWAKDHAMYHNRLTLSRLKALVRTLENPCPSFRQVAMLCQSAPERFKPISEPELIALVAKVCDKLKAALNGIPWLIQAQGMSRRLELNPREPGWFRATYDTDDLSVAFEWIAQDLLRSAEGSRVRKCGNQDCGHLFLCAHAAAQYCSSKCSTIGRSRAFYRSHRKKVIQDRRQRYWDERQEKKKERIGASNKISGKKTASRGVI